MFVLPDKVVKKIIDREIDYNSTFGINKITKTIRKNEIIKGYRFEYQARVNLALEKNYTPTCSVLESKCLKENCVLFHKGDIGRIGEAWVCREYKVDFPNAPFDSRFNVYIVGIGSVDVEKTLKNLEKLKEKGAKYVCLNCTKVYQKIREELYEDGHGGRMIQMCTCGSDLFEDISSFLDFHNRKICEKKEKLDK